MAQDTFINYRGSRWFWINLAFLIAVITFYALHSPIGGHNGGTVFGYTLGGIATAGILYLMWYGMRKRAYSNISNTLQGCLAAHVWIGVMLLFLVPLHAGFQFGLNVHTLAYVLMSIVVISGIWGAFNYATLANKIESHRGGGSFKGLLSQTELLAGDLDQLCKGKSDPFAKLVLTLDTKVPATYWQLLLHARFVDIKRSEATDLVSKLPEAEREDGMKALSILTKKRQVVERIRGETVTFFWMKAWLYFHLPVSFALVFSVAVHIFSVFYMW